MFNLQTQAEIPRCHWNMAELFPGYVSRHLIDKRLHRRESRGDEAGAHSETCKAFPVFSMLCAFLFNTYLNGIRFLRKCCWDMIVQPTQWHNDPQLVHLSNCLWPPPSPFLDLVSYFNSSAHGVVMETTVVLPQCDLSVSLTTPPLTTYTHTRACTHTHW